MSVKTSISIDKNLIQHTITDVMELTVIINTIAEMLKNPEYKAGMNAVWYFRGALKVDLTSGDLMYIAEYASKNIDIDGKPYKLALVAEDDLPYGLTRVYEAWSSERPVSIKNFRSIDDALVWVQL